MNLKCQLAERKEVRAFYLNGHLFIHAKVIRHTYCDILKIQKSLLQVEPPQFILNRCIDLDILCIDIYLDEVIDISEVFYIGKYREEIEVISKNGKDVVKVQMLMDKKISEFKDSGGFPTPFFTIPKEFEKPVAEKKQEKLHTVTGYSNNMSIEEALKDAIANFKFPNPGYPDELINLKIIEIGVLYGGIVGFTGKLYVVIG